MLHALNTLFVTTPRAYLHLETDTVRAEVQRELLFQMPLLHLGAIVCLGDVMLSTPLLHRCAEDGRSVVLMDEYGRFKARLEGEESGNVLLRVAQHRAAEAQGQALEIARACVAGKIRNARTVLLRGAREAGTREDSAALGEAAVALGDALNRLKAASTLDEARGHEGAAAKAYFGAFTHLVRENRPVFALDKRTRQPPIGRMNGLLSFLYTLVRVDCEAALEAVGLDPRVGYLHGVRPGKPSLALDLMEELRPWVADRLALTLVNRRQLQANDFTDLPGGATRLTPAGRKTLLVAFQTRKQEEVWHPVVGKKVPLGLVPQLQARLLARHLRGELETYPPFIGR